MGISSLFKDEKGSYSSFRVLLFVWTLTTIIWVSVFPPERLTSDLLRFIGGVYLALVSGAGGPRLAQYLAPQIGAFASSFKRDSRLPSMKDDERKDD